ncbi:MULTISPECIES: YcxB family protein [unclassified Microcoleus]|uniref:YcxB family protein n=1 Tax=unclassified Microcoleus TaxID=2642155 RepID=UPI002FD647DF
MKLDFQLNSSDRNEVIGVDLKKYSNSEESRKRSIHKWVFLTGLFFLVLGIVCQEKGFLVVGISLVVMPVLCKIFVKTSTTDIDIEYREYIDREKPVTGVEIKAPILKNSTNEGETMTVEVIEERLIVNTPTWQETFKWEAFTLFVETSSLFMIYPMPSLYPVSNMQCIIVPKRAFSGEEQLCDFRKLLENNMEKSH